LHCARWQQLADDPPDVVCFDDIPWIPTEVVSASRPAPGGGPSGSAAAAAAAAAAATLAGLVGEFGGSGAYATRVLLRYLGIDSRSDPVVQKRAIRQASMRWHPDKVRARHSPLSKTGAVVNKCADADRLC
jgi:hypothetical protein